MTNDEIKSILDEKEIAYPKSANKKELEALLAGASASSPDPCSDGGCDDDGEGAPEPYAVRVTAALLNVRCEPSMSANVVGTVHRDEALEAVGAESGWVMLSDGCYVMERFTERV